MSETNAPDTFETDCRSSPVEAGSIDEPTVATLNGARQQRDTDAPGDAQTTKDTATQPADQSQKLPNLNVSVVKTPPKRDPSKPSSNFTPIERTFILMAIAAVRGDPRWRRHEDPAHPDCVKDFSEPFCRAVRQKLMEDSDFKGRVSFSSDKRDPLGGYRQPSKESIRAMWKNLYQNGSLTRPHSNLGRRKDMAAEERVKQYLQMNPNCKMSSRAIAAQTQTSHRNVIRILRQEKLAVRRSRFKRVDEPTRKRSKQGAKQSGDQED